MRLIDADALKTKIQKIKAEALEHGFAPESVCGDILLNFLDNAPTIEAKPIVHAHWISEDEAEELGHLEWSYGCSNCKEIFWDCTESFAFSYCPHCGAQMDGVLKDAEI